MKAKKKVSKIPKMPQGVSFRDILAVAKDLMLDPDCVIDPDNNNKLEDDLPFMGKEHLSLLEDRWAQKYQEYQGKNIAQGKNSWKYEMDRAFEILEFLRNVLSVQRPESRPIFPILRNKVGWVDRRVSYYVEVETPNLGRGKIRWLKARLVQVESDANICWFVIDDSFYTCDLALPDVLRPLSYVSVLPCSYKKKEVEYFIDNPLYYNFFRKTQVRQYADERYKLQAVTRFQEFLPRIARSHGRPGFPCIPYPEDRSWIL